ncbi:MAG: hypothetical protein KDD47_18970, partial [Acidobacteria bacterium]|nr:hypothetical protein [Acidobacteriota bacterium]
MNGAAENGAVLNGAARNGAAFNGTPENGARREADCQKRGKPFAPPAGYRALRRRLSGDLDNIVLMALRKDPQRRYSSVDQLSCDVRNHLDGLPVRARKPT